MVLREEIQPYIDGNGLVAPCNIPPNTIKSSDNGVMYTAEYFAILKKSGFSNMDTDAADFAKRIGACINWQGMLCRVPIDQDDGQEQVDDYYGVLSACALLQNVDIPRTFLKAVWDFKGALNNVKPGTWTANSFLIRQPQLLCAMIATAYPDLKHLPIRLLAFPLFLYSALVIATSCISAPRTDTDARRLAWHLIQALSPVSLLCRLASLQFFTRLYKTYGNQGMKVVASIYYQAGHPFARYWVTE